MQLAFPHNIHLMCLLSVSLYVVAVVGNGVISVPDSDCLHKHCCIFDKVAAAQAVFAVVLKHFLLPQ